MSQALVFTLGVLFGLSEKGDGIRVRGIPTFPSGISDSVAAMGNSFQDNKPPPKDERPLINKLKETAEQVLGRRGCAGAENGRSKEGSLLAGFAECCETRAYWRLSSGLRGTVPEGLGGGIGKNNVGFHSGYDLVRTSRPSIAMTADEM
jgi:hypothetical protein